MMIYNAKYGASSSTVAGTEVKMRLHQSSVEEPGVVEDCLALMGETRLKIDTVSKPDQTEGEIFSQIMLLDSMLLMVLRIRETLSEDIKALPRFKERFQVH